MGEWATWRIGERMVGRKSRRALDRRFKLAAPAPDLSRFADVARPWFGEIFALPFRFLVLFHACNVQASNLKPRQSKSERQSFLNHESEQAKFRVDGSGGGSWSCR
jgi:hypothetical protein